ncbi:MAG: hypothetical protein P4N59_07320 [Negativicutes bacterium]|nr:hypothetical protein [Negativicutes bacterium]
MNQEKTGSFSLLPPKPDVCQECATDHPPEYPHNAQSLYYQTKFYMQHNRAATWADAMEHCSKEMKMVWTEELKKLGFEVTPYGHNA